MNKFLHTAIKLTLASVFVLALLSACGKQPEHAATPASQDMAASANPAAAPAVTPAEARAIAKEAYMYGYPMVDNYRVQYSYFVDKNDPEYMAPWNQIRNLAKVYTPDDKAIQTPNSDTPYSWAGLDLRAEPIVISVPEIESNGPLASMPA